MSLKKVKLHTLIEKPISGEWGSGEGSIKVIRTTNFNNDGTLNLTDVVLRDIPIDKVQKKKLRRGDIIIEKSGGSPTQPVGRVVYFNVDEEYLCNNFTAVLRPIESISPRYLFWCLYAGHLKGSTLKFQNKTTGIINLKLERYCQELEIPLPPLHIQEQIADTLDKADALRKKDQELLKKYDELAQSIFYDMFGDPVKNERGWVVKQFAEVGTLDRGVSKHRPRNAPELLGGPYPLIQTGDVSNCNGYIKKYTQTYSEIGFKQSKIWSKGTLCITIAANIAKTGILTFDACFPDSVVGFIPNNHVSINYVRFWLGYLQKTLEENAPESAQKNINLEILRSLKIPVPPKRLQDIFEEKLLNLNKSSECATDVKARTDQLFSSLLQKSNM